jgi:hypothetical protein
VFYVEYFAAVDDAPGGDLFFFDYGVVACWGLEEAQVSLDVHNKSLAIQISLLQVGCAVRMELFPWPELILLWISNNILPLTSSSCLQHSQQSEQRNMAATSKSESFRQTGSFINESFFQTGSFINEMQHQDLCSQEQPQNGIQ